MTNLDKVRKALEVGFERELVEALHEAFGQIDQDTHKNTWAKCQAALAKLKEPK